MLNSYAAELNGELVTRSYITIKPSLDSDCPMEFGPMATKFDGYLIVKKVEGW